jgi:hypothetical protein
MNQIILLQNVIINENAKDGAIKLTRNVYNRNKDIIFIIIIKHEMHKRILPCLDICI